jgi:hypothetical protein
VPLAKVRKINHIVVFTLLYAYLVEWLCLSVIISHWCLTLKSLFAWSCRGERSSIILILTKLNTEKFSTGTLGMQPRRSLLSGTIHTPSLSE